MTLLQQVLGAKNLLRLGSHGREGVVVSQVLAERTVGLAYTLQVPSDRILFRRHAWERMANRGISVSDVLKVLDSGDQIEQYPDDTPFPSTLMLGHVRERPLHVVSARDAANDVTYVVTSYEPDPNEWDAEFRRRRTI